MNITTIEAISPDLKTAILDDGRLVPITKFYNAHGEETDDISEAITFICGQGVSWFVGKLSDFERPIYHS